MKKIILVDIGCAGALHHYWNKIPINSIKIIGVDANVAEIGKLKTLYPDHNWIAAQVGKAKSIEELNAKRAYDIFNKKLFTDKLISLDDVCETPDFIKVDVDIAEDIANNFKITSMPTIIFIKNYIEIDRVIGANIKKIEEILKKHV